MIAKALTLTGNHSSGLDYNQRISSLRPAAPKPGPLYTVSCTNPWAPACALIDGDLMSQCYILKLQCAENETTWTQTQPAHQ